MSLFSLHPIASATMAVFAGAGALAWALPAAHRRWQLSRAKHPSLAGHVRWAQRVARWLPGYRFDETQFFSSDGAPPEVVRQRRDALHAMSRRWKARYARTLAVGDDARAALSDLQLTSAYRVPFPYSAHLRTLLPMGSFVQSSCGVSVTDLDGNTFIDLAGSYGVNLFGHDFYKSCIEEGAARVMQLGPVLGSYHPCVAVNVAALKRLSGLDEVSFHMSGTEAVMQAVRLARYHTGRTHLVRFCGAYHGWWDDVQPGPGNPMPPGHVHTLREMDERTLDVLRTRRDIACVLVNPLQALHPNRAAPGDSSLIDGSRRAGFDRAGYTEWLQRLRQVCSVRGIVLIFDEVFLGFRLAPGGAQQYFGVPADLVTYGKTLGGGLPVGVVCGRRALMRRFRDEHPADLCFARGTFNAHPYVMGAMQVFLERLQSLPVRQLYDALDDRFDGYAAQMNQALRDAGVPVQVANLSTVWTVLYTQPGRYHWMLPYYLREEGLLLSWVGSGRMIFALDFGDAEFAEVQRRFVAAALAMQRDGWWWHDGRTTYRDIRRQVLREMIQAWRQRVWPLRLNGPDPAARPAAGATAPSSTA